MSFADLLIDTCTIQRYTSTADVYGQHVKTWANLHADEPCRHVSGKGREVKVGADVHLVYDQMFIDDIDVTVQDRVIIDSETYEIIDVIFRQDATGGHHKQCYLEIVR